MRKLSIATLTVLVLSGPVRPAHDTGDAKAVIEKAIIALGGAENLSKYKAATFTTKGKFAGLGQPVEFTAQFWVQLPTQRKQATKFDISGMVRSMTQTVNGDKGWVHQRGRTQDMPPGMLTQQQGELYSTWVATILPLRDPVFKLSMVPETTVNDKPAAGVKVSHKGHPDITLYFDKDTGLPVKSVTHTKGREGKEVAMESHYSDYKDFDGVKQYTKLHLKRDGKDVAEIQFSDIKLLEKLDDKIFEKPADE